MPDTQTIPEKGDHVRLGVDPREVGIPPATVQEGSRLIVEEAALTDEGYALEVRPMGEETTYRLNAEHVIPID
jgi:hypothetical protein